MTTPRNKTQLLNWAVTTGRIPPHMRHAWAARFVVQDPTDVERALIAQRPAARYRDTPPPRPWASVAADDGPPTDYPTTWLTPAERDAIPTDPQETS